MSRHLRYTKAAETDLRSISRFIARSAGNVAVARRFTDRLREQCTRLASLPGTLGTPRPELGAGIRSTPHKGYLIFFRYIDDTLEIVNVLEGHRDVAGHFGGNDNESPSF